MMSEGKKQYKLLPLNRPLCIFIQSLPLYFIPFHAQDDIIDSLGLGVVANPSNGVPEVCKARHQETLVAFYA